MSMARIAFTPKHGQYLTIDAFIAAMILAVTLVIIFAARSTQPYSTQNELFSQGVAESLSQAKLQELNNPLVINMSRNGTITNLDNTVLQQATEFYFLGYRHQAFELLKNVTSRLIEPQYSFEVVINNDLIFNRTLTPENSTSVLVSSKKIMFGTINRSVLVYGPTIAEVRVWQ